MKMQQADAILFLITEPGKYLNLFEKESQRKWIYKYVNMKKIIVTIARGTENYGAWVENFPGVYGQGDTVEEAKQNLTDGLDLYVKYNKDVPAVLHGEYEYEYRFDIASFLEHYSKLFSKPALERLTGINQKQLFHYASGLRKPSEKTVRKIDGAFRRLTDELSRVHFI
jgi:predicted RNase H-like HicB family nuclease